MKNNKIKLIIFDAYGPILTGGYPDTVNFLVKQHGLPKEKLYEVIYKKYFNMAAERKITQKQAWVMAASELNLPIVWQELRKIHYSLMSLNRETLSLVEKLKDDYVVIILSKNTRSQFADVQRKLGFKKYFDCAINTWELGLPKASKKTMKYILKKFNLKSQEIIYIDDQKENLIEAEKMGINTIFYKNFLQFKKDLNKIINY